MKTIVITGPSGSGKSVLTNNLSKLFENTIKLKTDSYYRDNKIIKILSIYKFDIYDRTISIKRKEIQNNIIAIYNEAKEINSYNYDFKTKISSLSKIKLDYKDKNQFLIIEGIFAHRLDINYNKTINIICKEDKEICFKRRLKRDKLERGRKGLEVYKKFNKSWYLFYQNIKKFQKNNKVLLLNTTDKKSYLKLVNNLKKISN